MAQQSWVPGNPESQHSFDEFLAKLEAGAGAVGGDNNCPQLHISGRPTDRNVRLEEPVCPLDVNMGETIPPPWVYDLGDVQDAYSLGYAPPHETVSTSEFELLGWSGVGYGNMDQHEGSNSTFSYAPMTTGRSAPEYEAGMQSSQAFAVDLATNQSSDIDLSSDLAGMNQFFDFDQLLGDYDALQGGRQSGQMPQSVFAHYSISSEDAAPSSLAASWKSAFTPTADPVDA